MFFNVVGALVPVFMRISLTPGSAGSVFTLAAEAIKAQLRAVAEISVAVCLGVLKTVRPVAGYLGGVFEFADMHESIRRNAPTRAPFAGRPWKETA